MARFGWQAEGKARVEKKRPTFAGRAAAGLGVIAVALATAALPAAADEDRAAYVKTVLAIDANPAYGNYLSSQCSTCHGQGSGQGSAGRIPPIRGMASEDLVGALYDYRTGIRANEVMKSVADALGDEEVAALAAYYEELDPQ